ncbi:MAG: polymerase sigma-B factor [Thermoleophilaceae bacterium]|nr:polymerase sigma-B factor [Thermoleophilaceae bacterium]
MTGQAVARAPAPGTSHPELFAQHAARRRATQERRLVERYHTWGDLAAREELIRRFLPLARKLAVRASRGDSLEDVYQVASVAVVKGVDRYDPERGAALSSYLVPTILGEIKRHFRDFNWAMHMPRDMHDRMMAARSAGDALWQELGRAPTPAELAAALGVTTEEALELHEASSALAVRSLDAPREGHSGEDDGDDLAAAVGSIDERFETVEDRSALAAGLKALPERERLILKLRFEDDMLQHEIAKKIGISQMHVSRLLRRALDRLRTIAAATA